jgi:hypothetical protein
MIRIIGVSMVVGLLLPGALYGRPNQTIGPNGTNVWSLAVNSGGQVLEGGSARANVTHSILATSAVPTIMAFSPTSGSVGMSITITGTNFSAAPANNIVYFGAVRATVTTATSTYLGVIVPTGATYLPISVTVDGLTAYSRAPFIVTFPGGGSITSGSFAPKVDFSSGANPYSVAICDIDGDGKPDVALANFNSNTVSVLRNTSTSGSTTFASKVDFVTGVQPVSVTIGDVDGDGKPDLAVGNYGSNTVSVLMNTSTSGSITFASKVDLTAGASPWNVAIGDLDGDGRPDLTVGNFISNTVSVFMNTSTSGSTTFASKIDFATEVQPFGVVICDLDGDGKPDLSVGNNGSSTVSVFRNTSTYGSITFATKVNFATEVQPFGVAIGDVDGDGKPDLAVGNVMSNTVSVLRNTSSSGSITFASRVDLATGVQAFGVAFGDLDGDGKPDLAVGSNSSNIVSVFSNTSTSGSISFASKVDFATEVQPLSIAIGDIDGDGRPDLAVANVQSSTVSVFRNTISPPARVPTITSFFPTSGPIGSSVTITGTNFSNTPANNIVYFGAVRATVTSAASTSLGVTVPTGATYMPITVTVEGLTAYSQAPFIVTFAGGGPITPGTFAPKVDFATGASPYGIAISDLDGDGKPDFAVVNSNPSGSISVFRNTSAFGSITFASSIDFATGVNPFAVAISDLDGDGKPDIIVVNFSSNSISVFRNTSTSGSITFAAKVDFAGINPYGIAIGDMDADGKPDLVIANSRASGSSVSVFRNTSSSGSITFASPFDLTTGSYSSGVAISDIDGDGKHDIAVANADNNTVSVFRNTSLPGSITSSSFAAKVDISCGAEPEGIAIGDVDGDGKPDLVVTNQFSQTASVFRNISSSGSITASSFASAVDFAAGSGAYTVVLGDVDGDGKPDLVVGNAYSNGFSVLRNTASPGPITAGSFDPKVDFTTGVWPFVVAMGDLDGDGKPDVIAANRTSNTVSIFRNAISSPGPTVTSNTATNLTATSAMLRGSVNPNGSATITYYEWGTSSALATFSTTTSQSIGSGTDAVSVTANLAGLSAGTTYYYRAVGQNSAGTQRGSILSFATLTPQQQAMLIIGQVDVLVSRAVLNQGQGNALTAKLNAAIQQINKGNLNAAMNQLSAFTNQVEGLVRAGKISSADGGALTASANELIAQLSASASQGVQNLELQASGFEVPTQFLLEQNYPNPFNPSTAISFSLPSKTYVSLKVFDAMGREVATLVLGELSAGSHSRQWNATGMPSGVYFYRISAGSMTGTKKLLLLR